MAKKSKKVNWKKILCAILVCIVGITALGGIAALAKDKTKSIGATAFSRGDLNEKGEYVESEQSIYTEEAFSCRGLRIKPDFESTGTYDVYYYDYDDRLVDKKLGITGVYDEDYPLYLAKTCRIVIHPEIPKDTNKKDFKIAFYEVYSYANGYDITVDKDQSYKYDNSRNLYDENTVQMGKSFDNNGNDVNVTIVENELMKTTGEIAVSGEYEYYDIYVKRATQSDAFAVSVIAANSDDKILVRAYYDLTDLNAGEWCVMTLEVPDTDAATYLLARMPKDAECYILGYND